MKTTTCLTKKVKILSFLLFTFFTFLGTNVIAQNTVISTGILGTGGGTGGIGSMSFAVINNNSYDMVIDSMGYIMRSSNNGNNFNLYYSSTSLGGNLVNFPNSPDWTLAGSYICNVATSSTLESNFKNLNITIPANTALRFVVQNTTTPTIIIGNTSEPVNSFTNNGLTLAIGNYQLSGGDVGKWNVGTQTRFGSAIVHASIAGPLPNNDAGVKELASPGLFCSPGLQRVVAKIKNYGGNQINKVDVHWSIDGVIQTPVAHTQLLDTFGGNFADTAMVILGQHNFTGPTDIKIWTANPNGVLDTTNVNDTISVLAGPQLSGGYTINSTQPTSATNFRSFTEFTDYANQLGVCGLVRVNVVSNTGPYNEVVEFKDIPGSSSTNRIEIYGNGNVVQFNNAPGNVHMLLFNGTKYVTIDSLNFRTLNNSYGWGAQLTGGAEYITIQNSSFDLSSITGGNTTNSNGLVISGGLGNPTTTGAGASNCRIINNRILGRAASGGPYYGVTTVGTSTNNEFSYNTIENFYVYGLYINGGGNNLYLYNDISRATKTSVTTFYGIYSTSSQAGNMYVGNRVHSPYGSAGITSGTAYGMYFSAASGNTTNPVVVVNNAIYNMNMGGTTYGMYVNSSSYMYVYHNSITLDHNLIGSTNTVGIQGAGTGTGSEFKNNIINITGSSTGDAYGFNFATTTVFADIQRNNIYVNSPNASNNYFGQHGGIYSSLQDFQTANPSLEIGSPSMDPSFMNANAGNLMPQNRALARMGLNVGIPIDIDEFLRADPPTIGAYETSPASIDAAVISIDSPTVFCTGTHNVVATIANTGINQLDSVEVHWAVNGVAQTPIKHTQLLDTLDGTGPTEATVTLGNYNFTGPADIKVYVANPNGAADHNSFNDTMEIHVGPALPGGTYTINPSQAASTTNFIDFASFSDGISQYGICGPIVVNVSAGTYINDRLHLKNVAGTSAINTITIDGGDSSQTIITTSGGSGTENYSPLAIDGANYVTIRNMGFRMTGTTGAHSVVSNGSSNNIIENCYFATNLSTTSSTARGLDFSPNATGRGRGISGVKNNIWRNNRMIGGYYGIYMYGNSSDYNAVSNNKFIDNVMDSAYYYGIYFYYADSIEFIGNKVNTQSRNNNSSYGVTIFYCPNSLIIGNEIFAGAYGLYLYDNTVAAYEAYLKRPWEVVNNMVTTKTNYPIYTYYIRELNLHHNTFHGEGTYAARIYTTSSYAKAYDIRNNIFSGGTTYGLYAYGFENVVTHFDHNLFYGPATNLIYFSGTYSTLAAFQSANPQWNQNSIQMDPQFVSATDLHINGTNVFGKGDNSTGVTVDIDGQERPIPGFDTVSIGADEFYPSGNTCDMPIELGVTEVSYFSTKIFWKTTASSQGFEYVVIPCEDAFNTGTPIRTTSDTSIVNNLNENTCYKFYVRSACNSSDTSYYAGPYTFMTPDIPYYPIGVINTSDANGNADSLDVIAYTSGSVVGVNLESGTNLDFVLSDMSTGVQEGIRIYTNTNSNNRYIVTEGDSLKVKGVIKQVNGLTQMDIEGFEIISTNKTVPTADAVTSLDEGTESKLVELSNYVLLDPSAYGTYDMRAYNGNDTITIRVETETNVSSTLANPQNALNAGDTICYIKGVGGQDDPNAPYTEGYHIIPMRYSDLQICKQNVPYLPVGDINTTDANGDAESIGVYAWTSGIVAGKNLDNNGMNFTIIDMASGSQEGINVVSDSKVNGYQVYAGDSILVKGIVEQTNGMTQFRIDDLIEISRGVEIPQAIQTTTLDENTESKYVAINQQLILLDASQSGTYFMNAINEDKDTVTIHIHENTDVSAYLDANAQNAGDTICFIKGIGGQNDNSAPYTSGYYITPMSKEDITLCNVVGLNKYDVNNDLVFYPNPTNGSFSIETSGLNNDNAIIIIRDINGKIILSENIMNSSNAFKKHFNLEGQAKGLYLIDIIDGDYRFTKKLIIQ